MKNNRGVTIVEILISIIIISIVMVFLFSLLSQVKEEYDNNKVVSANLISQATLIREIAEDMTGYGVKKVSSCNPTYNNTPTYALVSGKKNKCIKIEFAEQYLYDNVAFILLMNTYENYNNNGGNFVGVAGSESWKVVYQRGYYAEKEASGQPKLSSWTPTKIVSKIFESNLLLDIDESEPYVVYTTTSPVNAASIVLPVVTDEYIHYDINIATAYLNTNLMTCEAGGNTFNGRLTCIKDSSTNIFSVSLSVGANGSATLGSSNVKLGAATTITVNPNSGKKLSNITCTNNWKVGTFNKATGTQTVKIFNNFSANPTVCTVTFE